MIVSKFLAKASGSWRGVTKALQFFIAQICPTKADVSTAKYQPSPQVPIRKSAVLLTLQLSRIRDVLLVTRITIVPDLIWNCNAHLLQARHDIEAEVVRRRLPTRPAIVCTQPSTRENVVSG